MVSQEAFKSPQNIDRLQESERIQRLYHQLGVVYSRTFLTGDWHEPDVIQEKEIRNVFEEVASVKDANILVSDLREFVRMARKSVLSVETPEGMMTQKGRHDFNRGIFLGILSSLADILERREKDIGTGNDIDVLKSIDENIHFFRDIPPQLQRHKPKSNIEHEEVRTSEGLLNVKNALNEIMERYK